jgi:hypothetical protein
VYNTGFFGNSKNYFDSLSNPFTAGHAEEIRRIKKEEETEMRTLTVKKKKS